MNQLYILRKMPLTLVLITVSVLVALVSSLGSNLQMLHPFFITKYMNDGLPEIMHGELWRLITPIFIHFGPLHIIFNMLWLYDLGSVVEIRQGSPRLGILVGVIAVISNLAEFYFSGPVFGGMSGVVYGLLAYIWVQGKLNPHFGLQLHQYIVYMMLIWFVLCWTGLLGPIANMAHTMGLVMGLVMGWIFSPNKKLPI